MPKVLKRTIQGFRFEWEGGEYIEITRVGEEWPFEVINAGGDGDRPPFTVAAFRQQIEQFKQGIIRDYPERGGWLAEMRWRAQEAYDGGVAREVGRYAGGRM